MSGDSFLPDIDDDEIERSIREINEAIQRSVPARPDGADDRPLPARAGHRLPRFRFQEQESA